MNCPYCGERVLVGKQDNMEGNAFNPVTGEPGKWRAHNACLKTTVVTVVTPGEASSMDFRKSGSPPWERR